MIIYCRFCPVSFTPTAEAHASEAGKLSQLCDLHLSMLQASLDRVSTYHEWSEAAQRHTQLLQCVQYARTGLCHKLNWK